MSTKKPQTKIEVGDIVVWNLDEEVNRSLGKQFRKHGPFIVEDNFRLTVRVRRLDGGTFDCGRVSLPFYPERFRRDQFLTAVRRAKLESERGKA